MRSCNLRSVRFSGLNLLDDACVAIGETFKYASPIEELQIYDCVQAPFGYRSFQIVEGLRRNVTTVDLCGNEFDYCFYDSLLEVLKVNTSIKNLRLFDRYPDDEWVALLFRCLANSNRTLRSLEVGDVDVSDKRERTALANVLENNPVLERLTLVLPAYPTEADLLHWGEILPSLSPNKTLKSLTIFLGSLDSRRCTLPPSLLIGMLAMLKRNDSLERLVIAIPTRDFENRDILTASYRLSVESYLAVLETLTPHTTPKVLELGPSLCKITKEETAQLVSLVQKKYWLEHLDHQAEELEEVEMWLKLNRAGRRYLVEDAPTVAQGVEVLAQVGDDLDCLFTHLLENPSLCEIKGDDRAMDLAQVSDDLDCLGAPLLDNPSLCDIQVDKGEIVHRRKRSRVGGGGLW